MNPLSLRMTSADSDVAGFTIIEMLIGLSLTALVASLLLVGITQLHPIQDRTDTQIITHELNAAADYVERILINQRNLAFLENNPERAAFVGEKTRMRFVAVVSTGSDQHQLRDVCFDVINADGSFNLQQSIRPRRLSDIHNVADTTSVISDLTNIHFNYLSQEGRWSDRWPASQRLPVAVRITLKRVKSAAVLDVTRLISLDQRT